jgi:WD40 repeat protein
MILKRWTAILPKDGSQATGAATRSRYAAFLSYSHHDTEIGEWLQKRLESYRVPSPLVGRVGRFGPIQKCLGKFFRDRVDLAAEHDLGAAIRRALDEADALIVLCSPRSAGSRYVHEELRTFKAMRKGERIFAAIVSGEPHAAGKPGHLPDEECFSPALIYQLGEDGQISTVPEPIEPIAADFRTGRDGPESGALKLIAALLGVGLDELVQREKQAERSRRRRSAAIAAAMSVLAVVGLTSAVGALRQRDAAFTTESKYLAREAYRISQETGDHAGAMVLALRGLPAGMGLILPRPYVVESERALVTAVARNRLLHNLVGHQDQVREAHFSPDGKLIASASWDGTSRLWNIAKCRAGICPFIELADHAGGIHSISFSSDGTRVVTASLDKTARVWRTEDGVSLAVLEGHTAEVMSASFSPDSTHVATASSDRTVRVYDLTACQAKKCPSASLDVNGRGVKSVFYSSDGRRLVASTDTETRVWSLTDCALSVCPSVVLEGTEAILSADGSLLATANFSFGEGHTARVWRLNECVDGGCPHVVLRGHSYFIKSVKFSLDGRRAVTASDDMTARVWDLEKCTGNSCEATSVLKGHTDNLRGAYFSPDGTRVVTASGGFNARTWDARVWDPDFIDCSYGKPCSPIILTEHLGWIYTAEFSPDGSRIVTSSADGTIRVWDANACLSTACPIEAIDVAGPQGRLLDVSSNFQDVATVSASGFGAKVWDIQFCKSRTCTPLILPIQAQVDSATFSPDSAYLVTLSTDKEVLESRSVNERTFEARRWGLRSCMSGACSSDLMIGRMGRAPSSTIPFASYSADGQTLLLVSGENADIVNLAACNNHICPVLALLGHKDAINDVAFSPNGELIATASNDDTTLVWRPTSCGSRSCVPVLTLRSEPTTLLGGTPGLQSQSSVAFAPDGNRIVTTEGRLARVWDLQACLSAKHCLPLNLEGHQDTVRYAAFSPDGTRVATASQDKTARLWNLASCSEGNCSALVLEGHLASVDHAAFSPDGEYLLTSSVWDFASRLWSVTTGAELMVMGTLREPVHRAFFSRDGHRVFAVGAKAYAFEVSDTMKRLSGDGAALAAKGCQITAYIGLRAPTRFQLEQALVYDASDPCERHGLLSWHYYTAAWSTANAFARAGLAAMVVVIIALIGLTAIVRLRN